MATSKKNTRKVGSASATADAPAKQKREKVVRPEFDLATAVTADGTSIELDENGRLTAVPANWTSDCAKLGRSNFATKVLQMQHRLFLFDAATALRNERREEIVESITELTDGLSPTKKKQKKLARLSKQLETLKAQLAEEGIDFDN